MRIRLLTAVLVALALLAGTSSRSQQANEGAANFDKQSSGESAMASPVRRAVTGKNAAGKSTVIFDGVPPNIVPIKGGKGAYEFLWVTDSTPADNSGNKDVTVGRNPTEVPPNGSNFRIVELAPGTGVNDPGMHRTKTIDYMVVLSGEIDMRMEDSSEVHLKSGDVVVQRGVVHGWINRGNQPCRFAVIMIGAKD